MASARTPVPRLTALVRNRKHGYGAALNLVEDRVGKVTKTSSSDRVLVFGPHSRVNAEAINRLERLGPKSRGRDGAALGVPQECFSNFRLGRGQNGDREARHSARSLALASAQETGLTIPARKAA